MASSKWNSSLYSDIEPVDTLAADGEYPLVVIEVSQHFREVHGIFYAVLKAGEHSERAYALTTEVIRQNSANYSAWHHRRCCICALGFEELLDLEMTFTANWIKASPKNYQVWFHRRWLIDQLFSRSASTSAEDKTRIVENEQDFVLDALNADAKNYNCFSHRVFLFDLTSACLSLEDRVTRELAFTGILIDKDVKNNSAWSYRRQTLQKLFSGSLPYDVVADELRFVLQKISLAPDNESAWVYQRSLDGWQAFPHVQEAAEFFAGTSNRFALHTLVELAKYHGQAEEAKRNLELLETTADPIRASYWRRYRLAL